ncbi:MAG: hypothetical protein FWC57_02520 [Endomicrobia bacterium]|nr:hypothetical protein [Endomicrobiia bacterium]
MKKEKVLAAAVLVLLASQGALFAQTATSSENDGDIKSVYRGRFVSVKDSYVATPSKDGTASATSVNKTPKATGDFYPMLPPPTEPKVAEPKHEINDGPIINPPPPPEPKVAEHKRKINDGPIINPPPPPEPKVAEHKRKINDGPIINPPPPPEEKPTVAEPILDPVEKPIDEDSKPYIMNPPPPEQKPTVAEPILDPVEKPIDEDSKPYIMNPPPTEPTVVSEPKPKPHTPFLKPPTPPVAVEKGKQVSDGYKK